VFTLILENTSTTLEEAQMVKDEHHRHVVDLTKKLERCKKRALYLINVEVKGCQQEVDKPSIDGKLSTADCRHEYGQTGFVEGDAGLS
jgi:hypothetical protein